MGTRFDFLGGQTNLPVFDFLNLKSDGNTVNNNWGDVLGDLTGKITGMLGGGDISSMLGGITQGKGLEALTGDLGSLITEPLNKLTDKIGGDKLYSITSAVSALSSGDKLGILNAGLSMFPNAGKSINATAILGDKNIDSPLLAVLGGLSSYGYSKGDNNQMALLSTLLPNNELRNLSTKLLGVSSLTGNAEMFADISKNQVNSNVLSGSNVLTTFLTNAIMPKFSSSVSKSEFLSGLLSGMKNVDSTFLRNGTQVSIAGIPRNSFTNELLSTTKPKYPVKSINPSPLTTDQWAGFTYDAFTGKITKNTNNTLRRT